MKPSVILYGREAQLLYIRGLVLKYGGVEAISVVTWSDMESHLQGGAANVLVLCHTLPEEECKRALQLLLTRFPKTVGLCLVAGRGYVTKGSESRMDCLERPEQFLKVVRSLMARGLSAVAD